MMWVQTTKRSLVLPLAGLVAAWFGAGCGGGSHHGDGGADEGSASEGLHGGQATRRTPAGHATPSPVDPGANLYSSTPSTGARTSLLSA